MTAMWSVLFYTGAAVLAFYWMLLRPVLKDQKSRRQAVRTLRIGDEVLTSSGFIAHVVDVITPADGPTELLLEIAPGVRVRALTEAVSRRLTTEDEPDTSAAGEPSPGSHAEPRAEESIQRA